MEDPKQVAAQLRKPTGDAGIEMANMMNESNKIISLATYDRLEISDNDKILEVGMGNGAFVQNVIDRGKGASYVGVDYSQTMVDAAIDVNRTGIALGNVEFHCASIDSMPVKSDSFDKFATVNTLYFWPDPVAGMREIHRVIKPGGKAIIAVRPKGTVQAEFIKYDFNFYEEGEIKRFAKAGGFNNISLEYKDEKTAVFDGVEYQLKSLFITLIK